MIRRATGWLLLALTFGAPAWAQDPPQPAPPPPEGERRDSEGNPLRTRGGPPWMNNQWADEAVRWLTTELDLDPGQQAKIKTIMEESVAKAFRQAAENFQFGPDGAPDYNKMRTAFVDVRVKVVEEINAVLTPEQRLEFEQVVDQFDRRSQSFEQQRRAYQDPTELFDPPPMEKRILLGKCERALFLGPDETAAVMPLVEKVIDCHVVLNEGRKVRRGDLRSAIDGGASDDEVRQRLDGLRQAEEFQKLELAAAQQALRDVLTVEQETRFVAMGLLE
jgi:Spy/CpxP family protein refolding chaperone